MNSNEQSPELKGNGRMRWTALFFVMKSKTICSCSAFMLKNPSADVDEEKKTSHLQKEGVMKKRLTRAEAKTLPKKKRVTRGLQLNLRN